MIRMKITTELRLLLNRSCALYQKGGVPRHLMRETLYNIIQRHTNRRYEHDQIDQIVEGFMEFWELA